MGLASETSRFGLRVLGAFASRDLADDRNTYRVAFGHAAAGDLLSDEIHTRVIGRLERGPNGHLATEVVAGHPGQAPSWSDTAYYDFLNGVRYGKGPRRFRTETFSDAVVAGTPADEYELWLASFDRSPRDVVLEAIRGYFDELSLDRPTSCHVRARLLDAIPDLYRLRRVEQPALGWRAFMQGLLTNLGPARLPELDYNSSPTCAWNPSVAESRALADELPYDRPFRMVEGRYPFALPAGVAWRNDEGRIFPVMTDVLSARACQFVFPEESRAELGCAAELSDVVPF